MYEDSYTLFFIIWIIAIFAYLEWCRRNRGRWFINPVYAVMYWFGIGFGVTAMLTWINGEVIATMGNVGMAIMLGIVTPIMIRLYSHSSASKHDKGE